VTASGVEGGADIRDVRFGVRSQITRQAADERMERRGVQRGQGQDMMRALRSRGGGSRLANRRFAQDQMRIGAAEAEGMDAGIAGGRRLPRLERHRYGERAFGQPEVGVDLLEMKVRRNLPLLKHEHRLDQPGHTRRGLQMPDVRLDRADKTGCGGCPLSQRRSQCVHLDGVAQDGARTVRFDVRDVLRAQPRVPQSLPDDGLLCLRAGCGQAVAPAILVDRAAVDHGQDGVAVALRVGQPLEHDDPTALPPHIPIGRCVEGLAAAFGREHAGLREGNT